MASRCLQCIVNHPLNDDGDFISGTLTIKTRNSEGRSARKYFSPTPMSHDINIRLQNTPFRVSFLSIIISYLSL